MKNYLLLTIIVITLLSVNCEAQDIYEMSENKNYIQHFEEDIKPQEYSEFKIVLLDGKTFELSFYASKEIEISIGDITLTLQEVPKSILLKGTGELITIKATNKARKKAKVVIGIYM